MSSCSLSRGGSRSERSLQSSLRPQVERLTSSLMSVLSVRGLERFSFSSVWQTGQSPLIPPCSRYLPWAHGHTEHTPSCRLQPELCGSTCSNGDYSCFTSSLGDCNAHLTSFNKSTHHRLKIFKTLVSSSLYWLLVNFRVSLKILEPPWINTLECFGSFLSLHYDEHTDDFKSQLENTFIHPVSLTYMPFELW